MAADEKLLSRVRHVMAHHGACVEKKMFGGVALLLDGTMAVAVMPGGLLVRIDPDRRDDLLAGPGTEPFTMGRQEPGRGWVVVVPDALGDDDELARWIATGVGRARAIAAMGR